MDEQGLIRQYRGLVLYYVGEISARVPLWVDRDDLTSRARWLVTRPAKLRPCRGVNFLTFARLRIRGAIYDELRRAHPMGRAALRHGVTVEHRSHDQLDSADERPVDAGLLEQERQAHLHDAVDALSPRLRFVVSGFYFQDRQVKDLAPVLGVSASRVSKMHAEALSHLRDTLEEHMRVVIYFAKDGWRWRAQARNGEIVSESGEAYEDKSYAIQSAKEFGPTNAVIFTDD